MKRRIPIGKKVGSATYFHKMYIHDMIFEYEVLNDQDFYKAQVMLTKKDPDFEFHIIKYDDFKQTISFISCPTFNILNEPLVDAVITVNLETEGVTKRDYKSMTPGTNPPIYHHKWLMVRDDYKNFHPYYNIEHYVKRSEMIEKVMRMFPWIDKKMIGYRRYWLRVVSPKLLDVVV